MHIVHGGTPALSPEAEEALAALSERERKFVLHLIAHGKIGQAALAAGYTRAHPTGSRLAARPRIRVALAVLRGQIAQDAIIDLTALRLFWADTMANEAARLADRLKASELAGRSVGAFLDRTEVSGPGGGPVPIAFATIAEAERWASGTRVPTDSGSCIATESDEP